MKRAALFLFLACTAAQAQGEHHGPVVYPAANTATGSTNLADTNETAPTTDMSVTATPTTPTVITPHAATVPPPATANPAPSPAMNPMQNIAQAANGQKDDIYDIRPPFFYLKPMTWLWITLGVLAAIALLVAAWFLFQPLRGFMRPKSPYELALEKLEKARGMLNEQDPEPYAVFVSETIRSYLGQQFRTPSTRRTTEEFLRQMQSDTNTPLLAAHRDLLRQFLEACDLVKFAHYQPERGELEQVQERAVSFVTATRPMEGAPA